MAFVAQFFAGLSALFALVFAPPSAPTGTPATFEANPSQIVQQLIAPSSSVPQQPAGLATMVKYTDADFGFTLWYPSNWIVSYEDPGGPAAPSYAGGAVKKIVVIDDGRHRGVRIAEYYSADRTITDTCAGCYDKGANFSVRYYFDIPLRTWMRQNTGGAADQTPDSADVSYNTMGGLHVLTGAQKSGTDAIVPLSAKNFLVVTDIAGKTVMSNPLLKTIVALDPKVATPVSNAEQQSIVQAEAATLGVGVSPAPMRTYTDDAHGFSVQYPASLVATTSGNFYPAFGGKSSENLLVISAGQEGWNTGPESIAFSMSADPADVGTCKVLPASGEMPRSQGSTVTINGIPFITYSTGDAAMGRYSNQKIYQTLHNSACFRIVIDTESSRTETTAQAVAQQAGIDAADAKIQPILQSLRFTNDTSTAPPPTCTLSTDRYSYELGDVIALTWTSQNATRALWNQDAEQNTGIRKVIVPPEGDPAVSGSAQTIANIEGAYQPIKMQVVGPGGYGECEARISVDHSDAKPSITVDSVRLTPGGGKYSNERNVSVTLSGTATNGGLFNNEVNIVLFNPDYQGPFDEKSVYGVVFGAGRDSQFYSGGTQPGVREDSRPFETWTAETFIPRGVTSVRVLAYYPFYSAGSPTTSAAQPVVNEVLDVVQ